VFIRVIRDQFFSILDAIEADAAKPRDD